MFIFSFVTDSNGKKVTSSNSLYMVQIVIRAESK